MIYEIAEKEGVEVLFNNQNTEHYNELMICKENSEDIFKRNGSIATIKVRIKDEQLR